MGTFGLHLESYRAIIFLHAIIHWVEFLFDNNLMASASSTLKNISNVYVDLYRAITPENSSAKIKSDGRELLMILRNLITRREGELGRKLQNANLAAENY